MELEMYFHCMKCLKEGKPSGMMEAGMKDGQLAIVCQTCKEPVFTTTLSEESKKKFQAAAKCTCLQCHLKN